MFLTAFSRFLQARKWDLDETEKMFRWATFSHQGLSLTDHSDYLKWRKEFNIDELTETFELTKEEKGALDQYVNKRTCEISLTNTQVVSSGVLLALHRFIISQNAVLPQDR